MSEARYLPDAVSLWVGNKYVFYFSAHVMSIHATRVSSLKRNYSVLFCDIVLPTWIHEQKQPNTGKAQTRHLSGTPPLRIRFGSADNSKKCLIQNLSSFTSPFWGGLKRQEGFITIWSRAQVKHPEPSGGCGDLAPQKAECPKRRMGQGDSTMSARCNIVH